MRATHGYNRGTEERFYIGNDRGDTLWVEGGGKQSVTEEPRGRKCPSCIVYDLSVHSKGVGGMSKNHHIVVISTTIQTWAQFV